MQNELNKVANDFFDNYIGTTKTKIPKHLSEKDKKGVLLLYIDVKCLLREDMTTMYSTEGRLTGKSKNEMLKIKKLFNNRLESKYEVLMDNDGKTIGCMNKNIGNKKAVFPGLNSCLGIRGKKVAVHLTESLLADENGLGRLEAIIDTLADNKEQNIKITCKDKSLDIICWLNDLKLKNVKKNIPSKKLCYLSNLIKKGKVKNACNGLGIL